VIGGCFDPEFADDSFRLIEGTKKGRWILLVSEVVLAELVEAPSKVRAVLTSLSPAAVEQVRINDEILILRDAYLEEGIVGSRWSDDAAHVAAATVSRADAIVSWNFQHIVRLEKMKAYNRVNLLHGYGILTIVTPTEVVSDEEK
jgi:predicted nucleic acid-binding protein